MVSFLNQSILYLDLTKQLDKILREKEKETVRMEHTPL